MATLYIISRLIRAHINALFYKLDLVQTDAYAASKRFNWHYVYLSINILLICFVGSVGLEYESTGELNLHSLLNSPRLFACQAFPRAIWEKTSVFWSAALAGFITLFAVYSRTSDIDVSHLLLLKGKNIFADGKRLKQPETEKILQIHTRLNPTTLWIVLGVTLSSVLFCFGNVLYQGHYRIGLWSALCWLYLFPLLLFHLVYAIYGRVFYVIATSLYVRTRQQAIIFKLRHLIRQIQKRPFSRQQQNKSRPWLLSGYQRFLVCNHDAIQICQHLRAYSCYWTPNLTFLFAFFIGFICQLAYALIFVHWPLLLAQHFMNFFTLYITAFLFLLTGQCAQVVKHNECLRQLNSTFNLQFQRRRPRRIAFLLKAESLCAARSFHAYGFHLAGNYRLTSESFHLLGSYISMLFISLIRSQSNL